MADDTLTLVVEDWQPADAGAVSVKLEIRVVSSRGNPCGEDRRQAEEKRGEELSGPHRGCEGGTRDCGEGK